MTSFVAFAVANLTLQVAGNFVIAHRSWRRTDRTVPFLSFWEVANRPLSHLWGDDAFMWPGTLDPQIARYWRAKAAHAFRHLTAFFALHLSLATAIVVSGLLGS
ncbi:hypothetical protein [Neoroseomonas soli]|uniref:Uncharacterized protein n=1 Tax=Neoroseomonas soli TaxID=1081025 RepID=A0A9X9WUN6_9PROT|nr:hypothetical protein [Neoroseomonas soli]MBR0670865.1 hypothetical protein [Neoroseomonas soli]